MEQPDQRSGCCGPEVRSPGCHCQNVRLYVKTNVRGTQPRIGGENFAALISRSARNASAWSPVEFDRIFVPVTTPRVFTVASTTTIPFAPLSEKASVGVSVKAKSESGG